MATTKWVYAKPSYGPVSKRNESPRERLKRQLRVEIEKYVREMPAEQRAKLRKGAAAMRDESAEMRFGAAGARELGGEVTALIVERPDGTETKLGGGRLDKSEKRASFENIVHAPAVQPDGSLYDAY